MFECGVDPSRLLEIGFNITKVNSFLFGLEPFAFTKAEVQKVKWRIYKSREKEKILMLEIVEIKPKYSSKLSYQNHIIVFS